LNVITPVGQHFGTGIAKACRKSWMIHDAYVSNMTPSPACHPPRKSLSQKGVHPGEG